MYSYVHTDALASCNPRIVHERNERQMQDQLCATVRGPLAATLPHAAQLRAAGGPGEPALRLAPHRHCTGKAIWRGHGGAQGQVASAQPSPGRKATGRGGSHTARQGAFLLQMGRGVVRSSARSSRVERARGTRAESDGGRAGSAWPSLHPRGPTALPAALPVWHPRGDTAALGSRWCGEGLPSPLTVLLMGDRGPPSPGPRQRPLGLRALALSCPMSHLPWEKKSPGTVRQGTLPQVIFLV